MPTLNYPLLGRMISRNHEVAHDPGIDPHVLHYYDSRVAAPHAAFTLAEDGLRTAEGKLHLERGEYHVALTGFEPIYRAARGVVAAFDPNLTLPPALSQCPTDTDKCNAIRALAAVIDDHDETAAWAKDLANGDFGKRAPVVLEEADDVVKMQPVHQAAVTARAAAYGPAYEAFIAFKALVRAVHGPKSTYYRRLSVRRIAADANAEPAN